MKAIHLRSILLSVVIIFLFGLPVFAQKELSISVVQGSKAASPHDGESVRVKGIVTAILEKGFYIQTPDGEIDNDPATSEGLYIYGENSVGSVKLGDLAQVDGTVTEFRPRSEKIFLTITEITRPTVKVVSRGNPLPTPIKLTNAELNPKGRLDQMERFEGMRVTFDAVVVAPTGGRTDDKTGIAASDGVFFATVVGNARPFREPGIETFTAYVDRMAETVPRFDMNPEMLRVDSDSQAGAKTLDVPAGATIKGLTGVIDYSRKFYTLHADAAPAPVVENIKAFVPVSPAAEREVTVGAFNLHNLFDDKENSRNVRNEAKLPKEVFQSKLNKLSLAIRNALALPDVLGVIEVENLEALKRLAEKINSDTVAAGQPDPKYVAYLEEGNDIRGIDVGYLVKSGKVKVIETKQLAGSEKLGYPGGNPDEKLYDRPPLMLRAEVADAKTGKPFAFTVIVNHFKSYGGIDDEKDGDRVRNKRRMQAEWLAKFVEERQKVDPAERILVIGDLNAFQFNDGYNDLVGILKGKSEQSVLVPSKTAYNTGLSSLVDFIDQRNRYSYTFDGSAQVLDHIMINKATRGVVSKFGYARVSADFPLAWANDATRPEKASDHDAPVFFMKMDETPAAATQPKTP